MKILHAYKLYLPDPGGIQTVMQTLIQGACDTDELNALVSRRVGLGSTEEDPCVNIHRTLSMGTFLAMPMAPLYPLHFSFQARKMDIIDYHYPFPLVDLSVAMGLPDSTGLIIHWHADIIAQRRSLRIVKPIIERTLKRADRIIVASEQHIRYSPFLRKMEHKCEIVPFGIEVGQWTDLTEKQAHLVRIFSHKFPRMILCVGRLVSYKGIEYLIDAMRSIDGTACIIGIGPLELQLKNRVKAYGIEDKVHFLGKVNGATLKCLYHACQIFAFPSIAPNEAFGVVQLEAMACKKPVINTNIDSAVPTIARHEQEGLTIPPMDAGALEESISYLLDNPGVSEQYGQAGFDRVSQHYPQSKFLEKTYQLYREVYLERHSSIASEGIERL